MSSHKFDNGQTVHAKENPCATLDGAYEIVCRLPMSGGDSQYWGKSLRNGHHRVVRQSDLVSGLETDYLRDQGLLAPHAKMLSRPGASAQAGDTATRDRAGGRQADPMTITDQSSYEAAISEGWRV